MTPACPRCGAAAAGLDGLCLQCLLSGSVEPGLMGGLELVEEIGRGGMGSVWKARHLRLGRTVAVKFLPPELEEEPEFRSRFEREARTMAMLSHPNIVTVHDFGQEEGRSYLVMEYVEGEPLSKLLPMAAPRALEIAREVCDALVYAHGRGVVHRDIKPENILVTPDGHVKVTDFGIARLAGPATGAARVTGTNVALGTPYYMSPEALEAAEPDPRMDVYSLGVVFYEMIAGRRPVGSFASLGRGLDALVRRALAPRPEDRYGSAAEFRDALRAAQAGAARGSLPAEENTWIYAVAMLQSISTAVALWAFLECITPRVVSDDADRLMIAIFTETLPDGTRFSRARFELWPTIAALATFAAAITPYGFLRRHWRLAGLEEDRPDAPVAETRLVLWAGLGSLAVYGIRLLLEGAGQRWVVAYIEPMGAMILVAVLFAFWVSVLNAWRVRRPLSREPRLWVGFALALVPPVVELIMRLTDAAAAR
jgi:serine/threonine-protein kinase